MLRTKQSRIVLTALAVLSFGAGIAIEPMFETSAHATIPARVAKTPKAAAAPAKSLPTATKPAPQPVPAAPPVEATVVPASTAPAADASPAEPPAPSMEEGVDPEKNVQFIEMKNQPERDGQGLDDPGRDVDMIDNGVDSGDASANSVPVPDASAPANDTATSGN